MPKISVLMPVYKTPEPFLREAVESILNQTAENFEFLILDDCPEDRAAEAVIASYDDARIKYFRNERNLGITGSRNRLMEMATGDYLAVADHDDVSLPQRLEKKQPIWTRTGNAASFPGGISFCAGNGGVSGGGRSIMRKSARRWRKGAPSFIRRVCCEGRNWSASGYDMRRRIRRRKIMRCLCACAAGRDFTICRKFCCCIGIFPKIRRIGGGGKCTRPTNGLRRRYARRNGAAAK